MTQTSALLLLICLFFNGLGVASEHEPEKQSSIDKSVEFNSSNPTDALITYRNAGIITSFIDDGESDLGDALAYLYWSELSTVLGEEPSNYAINMISLASVSTVSEKHPFDEDFHISATAMANNYSSPFVFWGVVRQKRDDLIMDAFLTLRPELRHSDLMLDVSMSADQPLVFQAGLSRTRYGFSTSKKSMDDLFKRSVMVRTKTTLLEQPRKGSAHIETLGQGEVLEGQAMTGPWYHVKTTDGLEGYIDIDNLKIFPLTVVTRNDDMIPRDGSGKHFNALDNPSAHEELHIIDMKIDDEGVVWYRVTVDDAEMWIDSDHVHPRFSIPSLHFLAGLYYFRAPASQYECQFKLAADQFSQFIAASQHNAKNTNLASTHQLLAASLLRSSDACGRDEDKAIKAYTAGVELTPYDATAYNLRAVSTFGVNQLNAAVVADLQNAIKLDNQDAGARATVDALHTAISQGVIIEPAEVIQEIDRMHRTLTNQHVARNIARIRHQQHLQMKTKGRHVLPIPETDVKLTFRNRTGAYLDLYVFENNSDEKMGDSYHLQLPDGDKTLLLVTEGKYEIAAEAPNPSVKPIYGEHTYSSKSHYELDFRVELKFDVYRSNNLAVKINFRVFA